MFKRQMQCQYTECCCTNSIYLTCSDVVIHLKTITD